MVLGLIHIGLGGAVLGLLWIWAVLDVIATDNILVRNLDKTMWLMLVIFVPTIGAVAWLLLGRPEGYGMALGAKHRLTYERPAARPSFRGPEDDPSFKPQPKAAPAPDPFAARERRLLEREAEIARREAALHDPDDPDDLPR